MLHIYVKSTSHFLINTCLTIWKINCWITSRSKLLIWEKCMNCSVWMKSQHSLFWFRTSDILYMYINPLYCCLSRSFSGWGPPEHQDVTMGKILSKIFGNKEMRILMLGLDAAGKTSILSVKWWEMLMMGINIF